MAGSVLQRENYKLMIIQELEKALNRLTEKFPDNEFDEEDEQLLFSLLNHRHAHLLRLAEERLRKEEPPNSEEELERLKIQAFLRSEFDYEKD